MRQSAFVGTLIAILLLAGIAGAGAQESTPEPPSEPTGPNFALHAKGEPDASHLATELAPGASTTLTVVIGNGDVEPVLLRTYAADSYSLVNGGFGVRDEDDPVTAPTTWLDYPSETYELQPGEGIERTFAVAVPEDTPPGAYLVGIAAQLAEPEGFEDTDLFEQVIRKIIGVTIVVPGPLEAAAELGEPSAAGEGNARRLVVPIANSGNTGIRPAGELTLTNAEGEVVVTAPIAMRPVYAGDETTLELGLPPEVRAGDYTVDLTLADDAKGWSAEIGAAPVTVPPAPGEEPDPVEITAASITPQPDPASPQYADVTVEITNRDVDIRASRLTLLVSRDGEVVEELPLSESLALVEDVTTVNRPYIPSDGWRAGTYTFSLLLESVDPDSGVEATLATLELPESIEVTAAEGE